MKALLIKTNGVAEAVEFPTGGDKLGWYYEQIGCDCIDIVPPYGLENIAKMYDLQSLIGKYCIICDDEALLKEEPKVNVVASLLYGVDDHGQPLCGDVLVAMNEYTDEGIDSVGMNDNDMALLTISIDSLIGLHNEKVDGGRNE